MSKDANTFPPDTLEQADTALMSRTLGRDIPIPTQESIEMFKGTYPIAGETFCARAFAGRPKTNYLALRNAAEASGIALNDALNALYPSMSEPERDLIMNLTSEEIIDQDVFRGFAKALSRF